MAVIAVAIFVGVISASEANAEETYTATFYDGDNIIGSKALSPGEPIVAPTPSKNGYDFVGWDHWIAIMPNNDLSFYSIWSAQSVLVQFMNGDETVDQKWVTFNELIEPSSIVPSRQYHHFDGWDYDFNAPLDVPLNQSRNFQISSLWTEVFRSVSFKIDDTILCEKTGHIGDKVEDLNLPSKEGYDPVWDGEIPSTIPEENIILQGSWAPRQYFVNYMDGNTLLESKPVYYDSIIGPPSNLPNKIGYRLNGWDQDINAPLKIANNINLFANWSKSTTITLLDDDGALIKKINGYEGDAIFETVLIDPKKGYSFKGWDSVFPDYMPSVDMTLNAIWSVNEYQVIFDSKEFSLNGPKIAYNSKIGNLDYPKYPGFYFVGWAEEIPATMPAEDLHISVNWKPTVKSGTGTLDGYYLVDQKEDLIVYAPDIHQHTKTVFGVNSQWTVSLEPEVFGSKGNVIVSLNKLDEMIKGAPQESVSFYSISVIDNGIDRSSEKVTITLPFDEPPNEKRVTVWTIKDGVSKEVTSSYNDGIVTFTADSASQFSIGFTRIIHEFPFPIVGVIALIVAAAGYLVYRRILNRNRTM